MARRFVTPVGLLSRTTNPASGTTGDLYYNSDDKLPYIYNGSEWVSTVNLGNIDGGEPTTVYGGIDAIDAGGV